MDVGIVVVDRDGHDLLMNRAQQRIHTLAMPAGIEDPDETQLTLRYPGTSCPIPPEDRPVRRAVNQETFSNYVVSVGNPGDRGTEFSSSARQILDRHGDRDGAVVVFSDVTSYVEAARTQQQFVAAVSHELRTPLTSVIGYLELAQDDLDLSTETASYLSVANRNAEQLLALVEDLLQDQVTRSVSGGLSLRPHRLSTVAGQVIESASLSAQESGIRLVQDLEETPELPIDEHRITQALTNLLSNALKYTPRGGTVTVTVSSRAVEGALEIAIADTGVGMSDQEQADLFTEFYRTESARTSAIQGHGIGLAVTRRIVLEHGGQISVRSTPGAGSTFSIRLPLEAADSAA
ncbi:ATP-binding protein [Brachybacterium tyrofermentans]|uniref:histidine kinase n=1 Tax=Brachybacterium tyrofermentans TaxID=47848 RepID=A0ABW0F9X7_9MICO